MTIPEMYALYGWFFTTLVLTVIALIIVMMVMIGVIIWNDGNVEEAILAKAERFFQWSAVRLKHFIDVHYLIEDETECPDWANPEKWKWSF